MKTRQRNLLISLAVFVSCVTLADLPYLPPKANRIAGTWVGHDQVLVEMVSIALATNGSGCFAYSIPHQKPTTVAIRSWKVDKANLIFDLSPEDAKESQLKIISATFTADGLHLELQFGKARRSHLLFREDEFLSRLQQLRDASVAKAGP